MKFLQYFRKKQPETTVEFPDIEDLAYTELDIAARKEFLDYILQWCLANKFIKLVGTGATAPCIDSADLTLQKEIYSIAFRNLVIREHLDEFKSRCLQDTKHDFSYSRIEELAMTIDVIFDSSFLFKLRWKFILSMMNYGPLRGQQAFAEVQRIFAEIPTIWIMYMIHYSMHRTSIEPFTAE